jgi:hypothetical protein
VRSHSGMSVIGQIFKSWPRQSYGQSPSPAEQPTRELRPNEIEVLRQAVEPIRARSTTRSDVLFGFVLGSIVISALLIFGLLIWYAISAQLGAR